MAGPRCGLSPDRFSGIVMTPRKTTSTVLIAVFLVGAAVVGCGEKEPAVPTILETREQPYVTDVPVPKGFKLDRRQSDHSYKEGRRKIKHYYVGSSDPQSVRNFYYANMPSGQWRLSDESLSAGVYTLRFRKYEETCEVRIEKVPAGMFSPSTQVLVTVKTPHLERPD